MIIDKTFVTFCTSFGHLPNDTPTVYSFCLQKFIKMAHIITFNQPLSANVLLQMRLRMIITREWKIRNVCIKCLKWGIKINYIK